MSAQNVENTAEKEKSFAKKNDVDLSQCATSAVTEALGAVAEQTNELSGARSDVATKVAPLVHTPAVTVVVDENDSIGGSKSDIVPAASSAGGSTSSSSSGGGGGGGKGADSEKRRSNGDKNTSRRKTRRGKTKRGKKRKPRPFNFVKTQWKFQVPHVWTAVDKRRAEVALASAGGGMVPLKGPYRQSDHPPLVPYNTNRFLMEDHMPHVLTPSEDEEEFLTKEFSSVYEDARSERLEGLSKTQLIQEYLQLEANFEQVTRRYNAVKSLSIREENESAVNNATTTKDAPESGGGGGGGAGGGGGGGTERRRLEDRIRELTAENLELRRQLEHASRIGMVLSAKSSPRNNSNNNNNATVEPMDSSSLDDSITEDSESDSSTSTSSSSSSDDDDDNGSSSSSMSDTDGDLERQPLVDEMDGVGNGAPPLSMEPNGEHLPNGLLWDASRGQQQNGSHEIDGRFSPLDAEWG